MIPRLDQPRQPSTALQLACAASWCSSLGGLCAPRRAQKVAVRDGTARKRRGFRRSCGLAAVTRRRGAACPRAPRTGDDRPQAAARSGGGQARGGAAQRPSMSTRISLLPAYEPSIDVDCELASRSATDTDLRSAAVSSCIIISMQQFRSSFDPKCDPDANSTFSTMLSMSWGAKCARISALQSA